MHAPGHATLRLAAHRPPLALYFPKSRGRTREPRARAWFGGKLGQRDAVLPRGNPILPGPWLAGFPCALRSHGSQTWPRVRGHQPGSVSAWFNRRQPSEMGVRIL